MAAQRAAEAALLLCRFACSVLRFLFAIFVLQVPKDDSPQSPEGLENQPSQGFERVVAN
jgi:hypothetical protein